MIKLILRHREREGERDREREGERWKNGEEEVVTHKRRPL